MGDDSKLLSPYGFQKNWYLHRGERQSVLYWELSSCLISNLHRQILFFFMNIPALKTLETGQKSNHKTQTQGMPSFISFTDHGTSSSIANKALSSSSLCQVPLYRLEYPDLKECFHFSDFSDFRCFCQCNYS